MEMNAEVDQYLIDGCGRCELYKTPQCKVHSHAEELKLLRSILNDTALTEEYKWSQPCYTLDGSNVLLLTAFKDYCCLAFFKGAIMDDPDKLLHAPGKSSQAVRQMRFTNIDQVKSNIETIQAYIQEAIRVEKSGEKIEFKKQPEEMPEELIEALNNDAKLKSAFEALTPGRQRGYILYFSGAKQAATRKSRIEKYIPHILKGKGFHDK